jgi:glucuronosyltransferase
MSTGTLVTHFDKRWTDLFARVFAELPQKVIWRYKSGHLNGTSFGSNVKLVKWMPQLDLLAHPQTRLFITHCGLNALFEAVYTATPVVAVPMSGDQMNNAAKLTQHANMGITVDMFSVTHDSLLGATQKVLADEQYAHNARVVAERFRDQPMSRSDKMNYWVDYVIRHKGAEHLKSSASDLSLVQYFCLDVILTICAVLVTAVVLFISLALYVLYKFRNYFFLKSKFE